MISVTRYLLDTNVLSEPLKPQPDANVMKFLAGAPDHSLHISALSLGEIRKGILKIEKTNTAKAQRLSQWAEDLETGYEDYILPVDQHVAKLWGELSADRLRPVVDTMLAATAIYHNLILVTRNLQDMKDTGVKILDPWK